MNEPLAMLELFTGIFFLITGFRKTFVPSTHTMVFTLFRRYDVPPLVGWLIVLGQLFGGLSLVTGILSAYAAPLLVPIMLGAIRLSVLPRQRARWHKTGDASGWSHASNVLCTPEVQILFILLALSVAHWS